MIDRYLNYGRHLIERYLKQSAPYEKVLDLGAGHGDDLLAAKKIHPKAELLAIENYPVYMQELRNEGVVVYEVNLENEPLPFPDESVDIIICNQILEHCKEIWWIFHEISRVLKVGGRIIIGVPNLASLHNRLLLVLGEQPTAIQNNSAHLRGYTKKDIIKFVNSGFPKGYALKGFGGSNFYPFPGFIAKPLAKIYPSGAWSIFMLFEKTKKYERGFLQYVQEHRIETNFYLGPEKK